MRRGNSCSSAFFFRAEVHRQFSDAVGARVSDFLVPNALDSSEINPGGFSYFFPFGMAAKG